MLQTIELPKRVTGRNRPAEITEQIERVRRAQLALWDLMAEAESTGRRVDWERVRIEAEREHSAHRRLFELLDAKWSQ